jgi:hypothetical protein
MVRKWVGFQEARQPDDIAGLQGWWKADALSLSDGDPVATWTDSSGEGNDAAGVGGARPLFKTAIQNGLPVVRWDGVDDVMVLPTNAFTALTQATVFLVIRTDTDTPVGEDKTGLWEFGSSADFTHYPFTDGNIYEACGSTVRKSTGNPALNLATTFRVYCVTSASGAWTSYLDNVQHFTTGVNTVGFPSVVEFGHSGGIYFCDGDWGECLIYDSALSAGDRTAVYDHLVDKWGL